MSSKVAKVPKRKVKSEESVTEVPQTAEESAKTVEESVTKEADLPSRKVFWSEDLAEAAINGHFYMKAGLNPEKDVLKASGIIRRLSSPKYVDWLYLPAPYRLAGFKSDIVKLLTELGVTNVEEQERILDLAYTSENYQTSQKEAVETEVQEADVFFASQPSPTKKTEVIDVQAIVAKMNEAKQAEKEARAAQRAQRAKRVEQAEPKSKAAQPEKKESKVKGKQSLEAYKSTEWSVLDLKKLASQYKLKGYSKALKAELAEMIYDHEQKVKKEKADKKESKAKKEKSGKA